MLPGLGMVPCPALNAHMGFAELEATEQKGNSNNSTPCAGFHPENSKNCVQGIGITGRG